MCWLCRRRVLAPQRWKCEHSLPENEVVRKVYKQHRSNLTVPLDNKSLRALATYKTKVRWQVFDEASSGIIMESRQRGNEVCASCKRHNLQQTANTTLSPIKELTTGAQQNRLQYTTMRFACQLTWQRGSLMCCATFTDYNNRARRSWKLPSSWRAQTYHAST